MDDFTLIEGVFTPDDAKEVLLTLIEYKIQFHSRKNFSAEIKYGVKDEYSVKRLEELNKVKERLRVYLDSPNNQHIHLSVTSLITINPVLQNV